MTLTSFWRTFQDAHIGDEATVIYNRARQFTEEKLGKAERTENDAHFEELAKRTDKTKMYTERIVKNTEAVLVPNPGKKGRNQRLFTFTLLLPVFFFFASSCSIGNVHV